MLQHGPAAALLLGLLGAPGVLAADDTVLQRARDLHAHIQSGNFSTEAEFRAHHSAAEIAAFDAIRKAAREASSRSAGAALLKDLKDDVHSCNNANPCTVTCSPCYHNWDYIVVNTTHLNSNSIINLNVENGNANVQLGPDTGHYWGGCCGQDQPADQDCNWDSVTGVKYGGTCKGQQYTQVRMWNNNYIEDEILTCSSSTTGLVPGLTNNKHGIGPGQCVMALTGRGA